VGEPKPGDSVGMLVLGEFGAVSIAVNVVSLVLMLVEVELMLESSVSSVTELADG